MSSRLQKTLISVMACVDIIYQRGRNFQDAASFQDISKKND